METVVQLIRPSPPRLAKSKSAHQWPPLRRPNLLQLPSRSTYQRWCGAKGFSGQGKLKDKDDQAMNPRRSSEYKEEDDKIPDVVWRRMIPRILVFVGAPLLTGLALLQGLSLGREQGLWDVPKWVTFFTTLLTFGASALGIALGSLSTSLDAEEEGSILGFEQLQKNWVEMWKQDTD